MAQAGCTGASLIPHLHFSVFQKRAYGNELVDPWRGACSVMPGQNLWQYDPPYRSEISIAKSGKGEGVISCDNGNNSCSPGTINVLPGTTITFKAVPYFGSEFAGWSGECAESSTSCTVTIQGSTSVTATFIKANQP